MRRHGVVNMINKETCERCLKETFAIEADCLKDGASEVDVNEFEKAVKLLTEAPRIGASACGHSGIACKDFAHLMCCIERPARYISPAEAVHGATGFLKEGDVMLLLSRGGKTKELLPILEICKKKKVHVITVTENVESILAKEADAVLKMHITRETDRYNSQGTTSTTAALVIFHALQAALIEATNFQNESFALIHPGGAMGEKLKQAFVENDAN